MLQKFMANRAEDMMRRMMGMPSRKEQERMRKEQERANRSSGRSSNRTSGRASQRRRHQEPSFDAARMMNAVAEDVEYTEIREFESTTIAGSDRRTGKRMVYDEEQVSDVEFVEIKKKN